MKRIDNFTRPIPTFTNASLYRYKSTGQVVGYPYFGNFNGSGCDLRQSDLECVASDLTMVLEIRSIAKGLGYTKVRFNQALPGTVSAVLTDADGAEVYGGLLSHCLYCLRCIAQGVKP